MKKRKKYNLIQNTFYFARLTWQKDKSVLVVTLIVALAGVGISVAELFLGPTVLEVLEQRESLVQLLLTVLGFTGILLILNGVLGYAQTNELPGRNNVATALNTLIKLKHFQTSYSNLDNFKFINMAKHANSICLQQKVVQTFWATVSLFIKNLLGFVIYLVLLAVFDPVIMVVIAGTTIGGYLLQKYFRDYGERHQEEESSYHSKLYYIRKRSEEAFCAKDVRLFGMTGWLNELFCGTQKLYYDYVYRERRATFLADVVEFVVVILRGGIAYWFCIKITIEQDLSAAEFLLYFTAIGGFSTWVAGMMRDILELNRISIELSIIRNFLDYEEPFLHQEGKSIEPQQKQYEVSFENVSFRYQEAKQDTIHDLNLTIHKGERLAIVGLNGAGKTSLIKLLCGLYDPSEGVVKLNGVDIKTYNRQDYYRHFAVVFQQFTVIQTSILQNIVQSYEYDEEKVWRCIEMSGLREVIEQLPQGIETHLGRQVYEDGMDLSGGQLQRLMLARALYKEAPILVLDEPTAALDPLAEQDMYERYHALTKDCTSVFISHRLASTRFCDRILFMENGQIVEEGSHECLLAMKGKYAKLFQLQSKYYVEEGATTCI